MRKSVDGDKLASKWAEHNLIKDATGRNSAREWLNVNVSFNDKALKSALEQTHMSGWVIGSDIAQESLGLSAGLNWDTWTPGNSAAADSISAERLGTLLNTSQTIEGLNSTTLERIATQLATGLDQGWNAARTAIGINDAINDPLRAMVIARTETSRALNESTISEYKDAGIEQIEWQGADPCSICEVNDGEIINLGDTFTSGDEYPPAHPNCICTTLPVIPESGIDTTTPEVTDSESEKAAKADGYVANAGMKAAAQRAIDWREQGHKGGTQIGATRARQIVSGEKMSADTVKRMFSFFSRHEVDKKATGFNSGEDGYPSPGRVAWDLWGGDAGFSWSRHIVNSLDVRDN